MKLISLLCFLMIIGTITFEDKGDRLVAIVGEDVVLPCSPGPEKNIELASFDWRKDRQDVFLYTAGIHQSEDPQFKGRVSHFPDELRNGNASIIIRNIKLSDSGNYSCYFPSLQQQRFYIELLVGAAPKPSVRNLHQNKNSALLQCEVLGASPKPEVVWTDSDGTTLPADEPEVTEREGNKYDVILNVTVTKTGHYTCVATQKEIYHQINDTTFVHFNVSDGTPWGWITGLIVAVIVAVVFGVLYVRECIRPRFMIIGKPEEIGKKYTYKQNQMKL